jgi:hypothetical protein
MFAWFLRWTPFAVGRRVMARFLTELLGRPPERLAGVEVWTDATVAPGHPQEMTAGAELTRTSWRPGGERRG